MRRQRAAAPTDGLAVAGRLPSLIDVPGGVRAEHRESSLA